MRGKPRARIFLVRIFRETRVAKEIARGPFPYIADHLPAALRRITRRVAADIAAVLLCPIEIRSFVIWWTVTPWVNSPVRSPRGYFPFKLCRKSSACPSTERFGLKPAYVRYRPVCFQVNPLIEVSPDPPTFRIILPVDRRARVHSIAPLPTFAAPQFAPDISSIFDKLQEFRLSGGHASHSKSRNIHGVSPLFVVENKTLFGC
jgi:hypothetical protein